MWSDQITLRRHVFYIKIADAIEREKTFYDEVKFK